MSLRGAPDPNPVRRVVAADQRLRRAAPRSAGTSRTSRPGRDARGFARDGAQPPEIETHLVNAVLTNGARYYVDHAHPEYSTPECSDPLRGRAARQGGGAHPRPVDGRGAPAAAGRARRSSSTRTTATARATRTAARELPRRPRGAVRGAGAQPDSVVRHPPGVHRARARSAPRTAPTPSTTRSASAPTSSRRRSGSRRR